MEWHFRKDSSPIRSYWLIWSAGKIQAGLRESSAGGVSRERSLIPSASVRKTAKILGKCSSHGVFANEISFRVEGCLDKVDPYVRKLRVNQKQNDDSEIDDTPKSR